MLKILDSSFNEISFNISFINCNHLILKYIYILNINQFTHNILKIVLILKFDKNSITSYWLYIFKKSYIVY